MNKGDLIAEVYDLQTILAEIAIPEKEIADVSAGQKVVVRSKAYYGLDFEGTINSIASTVTGTDQGGEVDQWSGEQVILAATGIQNPSLLLKPGMIGHAKVFCGKRQIAHLITRRLAGYLRTEFWSWW